MVSQLQQRNDYSFADYSNSCWFIDFALLDINIADTNGSLIGRPYLTTAIDIYSQCCMGLFLSLKSPNHQAITQALRHAILPKSYDSEYNLRHEWITYGIPAGLQLNNSSLTNSYLLQDKLSQLGISIYSPKSGSRLNDSFTEKLFSEINRYLSSDALSNQISTDNNSFLTLGVLEKILVLYFVDNFNQQIHNDSSHQTRQERWESGLGSASKMIEENFIHTLLT
ncbi:transposase [Trichormus variabilis ATCC 29413]|uniref:Transposase n=2 Tax=Anabaena variabilis TaxID=264691 RepID=Q3MB31_TRIV2|nr:MULTISPECIES: hypothetical protein [Nostocaceae]ABA21805.1 transposase [Trichormus variabilis ATCC 29413]MBC1216842.1 hypothetical protein [Trichormus variabilis ARAD]MBC1256424.1 hypothetical protein [Trichormus variabilis V5]MBC1268762.1 hypothetical protein [Trichormus variabilis FSR]MBC1305025.1 hypothetical protein [Trichormus variabilis N2B]